MATRRPNLFERERVVITFDHAQATATTVSKLWKVPAGKKFQLERASYINPTGLAGDAANAFTGAIKNGADVMATLFNTETDNGGAALAADTFVEGTLHATPTNQWADAGDVVDLTLTEVGTATLPAGRVVLEGYLY